MVGVAVLYWIGVLVFVLWLWSDATIRHGAAGGLLWTLVLVVGGPVGLIAYLLYGRQEPPDAAPAAEAQATETLLQAMVDATPWAADRPGAAAVAAAAMPEAPEGYEGAYALPGAADDGFSAL